MIFVVTLASVFILALIFSSERYFTDRVVRALLVTVLAACVFWVIWLTTAVNSLLERVS